jgi:hypothetical protein
MASSDRRASCQLFGRVGGIQTYIILYVKRHTKEFTSKQARWRNTLDEDYGNPRKAPCAMKRDARIRHENA